jgi:hypothetical protein
MQTCGKASAEFEWRFSEFFSSSDGSVQFIELDSQGTNEVQASGAQIHSLSTGMTLTLTQDLSGSTLNKKLLLATSGFGTLPGSIPADFAATPLPPNFFDPSGDTITLLKDGLIDSRTFTYVPTGGSKSRHYPSDTVATNSPTNFAGFFGEINLSTNFGDYNDDGAIDAADYVVYKKHLDTLESIPNDETPGWVMVDDHEVWKRRFGTSGGGSGGGSPVPELACHSLSAIGASLSLFWRRRGMSQAR